MQSLCLFRDEIFSGEIQLNPDHRGLNFGDGIFETILYKNSELIYLSDHLDRLEEGCILLGIRYPGNDHIIQKLQMLLEQCPGNSSARLKVLLFRKGAGNYIAPTNETELVIKISALADQLNHSPVWAKLINQPLKLASSISMVKSVSAHIYTYAGYLASQCGAQEAILLNQWGRVCEGIHGNVFWKMSEQWYTPPITEGCIAGVMRKNILKAEPVIEKPCEPAELLQAEAVYFANVIRGKYRCEKILI